MPPEKIYCSSLNSLFVCDHIFSNMIDDRISIFFNNKIDLKLLKKRKK